MKLRLVSKSQTAPRPLWLFKLPSLQTKSEEDEDIDTSSSTCCYRFAVEVTHWEYDQVLPFLCAIAVPRSRTALIHEYEMTPDSARSAAAVGYTIDQISAKVAQWSYASEDVVSDFVRTFQRYVAGIAKVRLILGPAGGITGDSTAPETTDLSAVYKLESTDNTILNVFLKDKKEFGDCFFPAVRRQQIEHDGRIQQGYTLQLKPEMVEKVKRVVEEVYEIPLETMYDFTQDKTCVNIEHFMLRPSVQLRPYQREAVQSVFNGNRAKSGIVVLPCGAGKTLTAVTIASLVGKQVLVFCVNTVSVGQWKQEFLNSTSLREHQVSTLTGSSREELASVVITTYSIMSFAEDKLNPRTKRLVQEIKSRAWGLIIYDEVHVAPADKFRLTIGKVKGSCLLGLTATLLREDDRIDDLFYLVGPKLYECSSHRLSMLGYLAPCICVEVHCMMPPYFMKKYLTLTREHEKTLLYNFNPEKIWACQALIEYHERQGDKVLVFCGENIALLEYCARLFGRPLLHGDTNDIERENVISHFKYGSSVNTVFISRVGDSALDIPDANVLIQMSSLFGSQRTEVQRLGRILRIKSRPRMSYFYSLITSDTKEHAFSIRRQRFLLDQGYGYKVVKSQSIRSHFQGLPVCVGKPKWVFEDPSLGCPIDLTLGAALDAEIGLFGGSKSIKIDGTTIHLHSSKDETVAVVSLRPVGDAIVLGSGGVLTRGTLAFHTECDDSCYEHYCSFALDNVSKDWIKFCKNVLEAELSTAFPTSKSSTSAKPTGKATRAKRTRSST